MGVDELAARKGHKYLTIFADMVAKRALYAVPGRDSATWKQFVKELKKHSGNRKKIKCVSMDMSVPYQKGIADNCPNAEVVFDKFHLIAKANKAVNDRARSRLLAWCRWVRRKAKQARFGLLAAMVKVAKCIENHLEGILKYWDQKMTNAYMEGINNMFQMVKRRARGYRNDYNFIMMIYFVGSKLTLPATIRATHSK